MANTLGQANPYRYRGYRVDTETGLYYLQSRYYDANVGRFVNADDFLVLGFNDSSLQSTCLFVYCKNPVIGYDPTGMLDATGVATWLNASSVFAIFAESLYTALAATLTKIGLYITGFLLPKVAAAFWWQPWLVAGIVVAAVAIVVATVAIIQAKAVSKADAKIREIVRKNNPYQYWSANLQKGYVDIGRPLTYLQAVAEVAAGRSVFTVTRIQAEAVAYVAGGKSTPMWHAKHKDKQGYYDHFHVNGHANGAHVWYLF